MSDLQITAEPTPNPNSAKFTLNRTVSEGSSKTYTTPEEAEDSPLARALLGLEDVKMVFFLNNFITVTKEAGASWNDLVPKIDEAIRQHLD